MLTRGPIIDFPRIVRIRFVAGEAIQVHEGRFRLYKYYTYLFVEAINIISILGERLEKSYMQLQAVRQLGCSVMRYSRRAFSAARNAPRERNKK